MLRRPALAVVLGCLSLGACRATDDPWTFKLTREAIESGYWSLDFGLDRADSPMAAWGASPVALVLLGAIVVAPPVLDLAFLPVAGMHDVLLLR